MGAKEKQTHKKQKCIYFIKGSCRNGSRCKFAHMTPESDLSSFSHLNINPGEMLYELEIRFPPGNSYPNERPYLAFSSTNTSMPNHMCLLITNYLMQETISLAESGLPAVFSLVSCIEDETVIHDLSKRRQLIFSLPEPVISRFPRKESRIKHDVNLSQSATSSNQINKVSGNELGNNQEGANEDDDNLDLSVTTEDMTEPVEPVPLNKPTRKDILPRKRNPKDLFRDDQNLKERFKKRKTTTTYKKMLMGRQKLPAWSMKDEILKLVEDSQVVVVSGMTGCGKTTQVPQFILDSFLTRSEVGLCNVVCTQPRRISAVAVADRVAQERAERLGGIVGYQIRLESVQSSQTRLLFCTTGIILRRLEGDPQLQGVTHVIIDEVHERSEDSDFLIMVLRDLLFSRPDLKVMLMSATVNAELFSAYFDDCPVIEIPVDALMKTNT